MNNFETFLFISPRVTVIDVDTEFDKNWAFLCTISPIFPFFLIFEDMGEFGEDGTKFSRVVDSEWVCYANMQFGRNWWFLTTSSLRR